MEAGPMRITDEIGHHYPIPEQGETSEIISSTYVAYPETPVAALYCICY